MNRQIVKSYIEEYKQNFDQVHKQEIYKWKAIKQFQDNFDIYALDFYHNLDLSLSKSGNLLVSGKYYPKIMLLDNVRESPEQVREMFKFLYDEDFDILQRVENFRSDFKRLNKANFKDLNDYQDHRAILVYLTLNYPERYFFYKFKMFHNFSLKIDFPYRPSKGQIENIGQFQHLCELIKYEIEQDQDLLNLHEKRLDLDCYRDKGHHVLTQDFIYAVVRHLQKRPSNQQSTFKSVSFESHQSIELKPEEENIDFTPKFVNYIQNNIENKRLGDLGEIWVLNAEIKYLMQNGKSKLAKKVKHAAKDQGDGLGYDIISFDLDGNKKFIEVKTTKGDQNSPFYISRNELERSKIEKENFFLYRVYNFNENTQSANLLVIKGDLTHICTFPTTYKVTLESK